MKQLTPFIIVALCFGMYFLYISPLWTEVSDLQSKKTNYDNVLSKIDELKAERDGALNAYASISPDDLAKLEKIVPQSFDSVKFLNDMGVASSRYGLSMDTFDSNASRVEEERTVNSQPNGGFKTNSVNIRVMGTLPQFINFLKELESSLKIIDVTTLNIVPVASTKGINNLQYTLGLTMYSLQ
jgi:Tfp pilus assembly protein PilO